MYVSFDYQIYLIASYLRSRAQSSDPHAVPREQQIDQKSLVWWVFCFFWHIGVPARSSAVIKSPSGRSGKISRICARRGEMITSSSSFASSLSSSSSSSDGLFVRSVNWMLVCAWLCAQGCVSILSRCCVSCDCCSARHSSDACTEQICRVWEYTYDTRQ